MSDFMICSYIINFIMIIVIVFFQRRDPIVSIAWVMCFMFMPLLGPILFMVFGLGIKRRTSRVYHKKHIEKIMYEKDSLFTLILKIDDMMCEKCEEKIREVLLSLPYVKSLSSSRRREP